MHRAIIFCIGLGLLASTVSAEDYISKVKQGNEAFAKKEFSKAVDNYREADLDKPGSPEIEYNVAGGLHALGKYEEAVSTYERALKSPLLPVQAEAHYNLGSTHYRMGDYQKAIESFQEALKINPNDMDAKYNLELARKMLKENMKPQDDQKDKNKEQQQKQDQQKQDQQQQQQDQQKKDEQKKQNDQQDQKDQDKQEQQPQGKPKEISKEDAERILNSLKDDEQKVQKKVRRAVANGNYAGKDW